MIVFVLGATGYIGEAVAVAFRRAGYVVYGSTRSAAKVKELQSKEIIPIIGDSSDPSPFRDVLLKASIVIDAIGYAPESPHGLSFYQNFVNLQKQKDATLHTRNFKPMYIFTSGIMIYASGERVDFSLDESIPAAPRDPIEMLPKKEIEDAILSCTDVRGVVVRPGFVYGGTGGVLGKLFFGVVPNERIELAGGLEKRWSWVHKDDLGDAYVRIGKGGSEVDNQIFNIAEPNNYPTWLEVKYACAKAAGWQGKKEDIVSVPLREDQKRQANWEWNVMINPRKAQCVLGWQPTHIGIVLEADVYYASWKAAQ